MKQVSLILILVLLSLFGCNSPSNVNISANKSNENSKLASELHARGLKLYDEGKYEEAIQAWEEELMLTPENANAAVNIGIAYSRLKKSEKAFEYYKKALEKDPKFFKAYYLLGVLHYQWSKYDQAREYFLEALKLNHMHADLHYQLGQTYRALGNCEESIKAFDRAVELKPDYRWVYYYLGRCEEVLGKAGLEKRGVAIKRTDPYKEAWAEIAQLEAETKSDPTHSGKFFKLAVAYRNMNDNENAIKAFEKVVELEPTFPNVHFYLV